jgi:hypothetical protein
MEELVIVVQTMVREDIREEEAQSLREYVEEVIKFVPQKLKKKKKTWQDEVGLNRQRTMKGFLPLLNKRKENRK